MKYDFSTRRLYPFSDKWENGLQGELWYIWEDDAICIVNGDSKYPIAKGVAAAMMAQKHALFSFFDQTPMIYKAYNQELIKSNFPNRYPYQEQQRMFHDWLYTLQQLEPIKNDFTGYLDYSSRITVGIYFRNSFNPYKEQYLKDKLQRRAYLTCELHNRSKWQFVFSTMPNEDTLQAAPIIWIKDIDKPYKESRLQVHGFLAALINYVIYCHWQEHWTTLNFADIATFEKFLNAWEKGKPITELAKLSDLQFNTSVKIVEFCKTYIEVFLPISQQIWERNPNIPIECLKEDNIYSYLYARECESMGDFFRSELFQNFTYDQQRTISGYGKRFLEFLTLNYHITYASSHRIMDILGKDLPPIELEITTNTQITRGGIKLPRKNNYNDLIIWLEQEKQDGKDHYADAGCNRSKMCRNISKIVGWNVDQNSLQKAQNKK